MSSVDASLIQHFMEKLHDNNAKLEGVIQAYKDTSRWVEKLNDSLHEEFNRTRVLAEKVTAQDGTIRVLLESLASTKDSLRSHREGHWRFSGLIVAATGALVAVLNYLARRS